MGYCNDCEKDTCNNGEDCWYLHNDGCDYCHCEDGWNPTPAEGTEAFRRFMGEEEDDYENDYSVEVTIHNVTREQGNAAVDAAVDAVEELRKEGQSRHDGTANVDKTQFLFKQDNNKKLGGGGNED